MQLPHVLQILRPQGRAFLQIVEAYNSTCSFGSYTIGQSPIMHFKYALCGKLHLLGEESDKDCSEKLRFQQPLPHPWVGTCLHHQPSGRARLPNALPRWVSISNCLRTKLHLLGTKCIRMFQALWNLCS